MAFGGLKKKPNIVILMTDEQRHTMHWPQGWAEENLPSMRRLMDNGLTFENAFANACTCSPSRTTMFTGTYPAHHGVTEVLEWFSSQPARDLQGQLASGYQNMAKMLRTAGYEVTYKGKWHMTRPLKFDPVAKILRFTDEDIPKIAGYGFDGWNQPDAGEGIPVWEYGGGRINNDGRYVDGYGIPHRPGVDWERSALAFLDQQKEDAENPFCLVVSLVNPHDVLAYPGTGKNHRGQLPAYLQGGYSLGDFQNLAGGFDFPSNYQDDLSTKPWVQRQSLGVFDENLGILHTDEEKLNYIKFYAYLHKVVDNEMMKVLRKLDEKNLTDSTLIIRVSDHGDLGMSHGGMRQKTYNAYEEAIHVPMIFSNPVLWGNGKSKRTQSLAGLIDLMPTLATIAEVPHRDERWTFQGFDLTPVLDNPSNQVQDNILFTFDDVDSTLPLHGATHIRCLRTDSWKYAVYFDPITGYAPEYELYCHEPGPDFPGLERDPGELVNLAHPEVAGRLPEELRKKVWEKRQALHQELTEKIRNRTPDEPKELANRHTATIPDEIVWPKISGVSPTASSFEGGLALR
jgi:arylsulfatase A-like enzyme